MHDSLLVVADAVFMLGGIASAIRGVSDFISGAGISLGSILGAGPSGGTSLLAFGVGIATAAVGAGEIGIGLSLIASGWSNGREDMANLKKAISEMAGKAAEICTSFGKQGTLVENPGIKVDWGQFSKHGLGRMLERNVTTDQVNEWVRTGKALQQGANKYLFITQDGAAVVADGKLVTVMSKYDYDEAMEAVVKTLFGN